MRPVSQRSKLVGGVFGVVVLVWGIDLLTGGPEPSPASAAPSPTAAAQPVSVPPEPADLDALIESLRSNQAGPPLLRFEEVARDPFLPTPTMEAALAPVAPTSASEPPAEPVAEPLPFDARHELQGILSGRVPLALIDGVLLPCGAEVDGYRLVELQRDYVVFQQGESRVILRMAIAGDAEE